MCFQNYPGESSLQMTTDVLKTSLLLSCVFALASPCMRRVSLIDRVDQGLDVTETVQSFGVDPDSITSRAVTRSPHHSAGTGVCESISRMLHCCQEPTGLFARSASGVRRSLVTAK
jgi:hypothetical protein